MRQHFFRRIRRGFHLFRQFTREKSLQVPTLVFTIFVIYVLGNFAISHYHPVETTPAVQVRMDDSISATGYFIREEQVIEVSDASMSKYNYSDGDKVAMEAPLVTIYKNDASLQKSQTLEDVESEITQLESLQNNSYVTNTSQIDQKITSEINSVGDAVDSKAYDQLSGHIKQLRTYALQSSSMNGNLDDIDARLKKLYGQRSKLKEELENRTSVIYSEYSGYFCQTIDGYENILTMECIDDLTVSSLDKLVSRRVDGGESGNCKIVSEYIWYYATVLSESEASRLSENQEVTLRFAQPSDNVKASVYAIRPEEESGKVLVLFRSYDMNSDLISKRKEVGSIVLASYTGLKVPTDAIHVNDDGDVGVYILNNTVSSFKTVVPVYKGSEYYIVKQGVIGDNSLVVNDDIIVHAKDIDDKKVVK